MRWSEFVVPWELEKYVQISARKSEGKRLPGRHGCIWGNDVKMDHKNIR
jgi:hypothetical protein